MFKTRKLEDILFEIKKDKTNTMQKWYYPNFSNIKNQIHITMWEIREEIRKENMKYSLIINNPWVQQQQLI